MTRLPDSVRRYLFYGRLRSHGFDKEFAWALACALYPREIGDVSGP